MAFPGRPGLSFAPTQSEVFDTETAYRPCAQLPPLSSCRPNNTQCDNMVPGDILEARKEGISLGGWDDPCSADGTAVPEDVGVKAMQTATEFSVKVSCGVLGSWLAKPSACSAERHRT